MDVVTLDECEVCYARYSNTDLKCAECSKCICVSCCNNLREYKSIENDEGETSLFFNFKCPFCRCENEKTGFENINKDTLLDFVKKDYNNHIIKIEEAKRLNRKYRTETYEHIKTKQLLKEVHLKITDPTTNPMNKEYYETVELLEDKIDKIEDKNKQLKEENSTTLNLLKSYREQEEMVKSQRIDNKKLKNIIQNSKNEVNNILQIIQEEKMNILYENSFFKNKQELISNLLLSTYTPKKILRDTNKILIEQPQYINDLNISINIPLSI
jgi:Glu-tRNA(Gln) amidotransferase subunit E-like FAD-binding protein